METKQQILDDPLEDDERPIKEIKNINSYLSILIILIGIYLVYDSVSLYYYYNYTEINFAYMKSSLELGGELSTGLCSIFCGVYCWIRYPIGLQSLFLFGILLITYSLVLTFYNSEFLLENIFNASPFFISGILVIGYSRWKKLKWIYKNTKPQVFKP
ncbi:MAG: hypothetical protein ACJAT4_000797 [Granulosicoccus sp.]|jgi:hypothetical protein